MHSRDRASTGRSAASGAQAGAAASLPALSRRLGQLALVQAAATVVPSVTLAVVVAGRTLFVGDTDAWVAIASAIGAMLAGGAAVVGAARLREAEATLMAAADDLDRRSRARAAELAQVNAELARVGRQRSELFASMSHELRTPLNSILGYSRALLDDLDGELTPEQREDVAQIHASGRGLLGIVNDVLDFSKLEAGRIALRREPVHARTTVEDVLGRVRPLAAQKGLRLINDAPEALPPALADDTRTRQVLLNLVANAIKFTDEGSVRVTGEVRDGAIHLSVIDTGIGIPVEDHELIFEPFRQADQRDTRRHGGTGLGLAICRQLVVGMGGKIWLESTPGRGSTFHVTLPVADDGATNEPDTPIDAKPTVLMVVGAGEQIPALTRACEREGLTPALTEGGSGPRDALTRRHPALALVDVAMPRAAGWQAFHALRADAAGREVPAVLYARHDHRSYGLAVGPTDYLLHPAVETELVARLGDLVDADTTAAAFAGPRTVLIATADDLVGVPIAAQLERAGYDLCRAASASESLGLLRTHRFVALILDLLVPGGALSTLAELRDGGPLRSVPVVLVSPPTLSPVQQRGLYADVVDIVRRRGSDGPPAADAIRRALAGHHRSAVATGSR